MKNMKHTTYKYLVESIAFVNKYEKYEAYRF